MRSVDIGRVFITSSLRIRLVHDGDAALSIIFVETSYKKRVLGAGYTLRKELLMGGVGCRVYYSGDQR